MKKSAEKVIQNYGTRNPYEIAKAKGIVIVAEQLGAIHGYYNNQFKNQIHINESLPIDIRRYILACLLYHAVLHQEETIVLKEKFHENITDHEKQLHKFAYHLLNEE